LQKLLLHTDVESPGPIRIGAFSRLAGSAGSAGSALARQQKPASPRDQCHSQRYNQSADNSVGVVWEVALNEFQVV
jgi:hypothetical protein